MVDATANYATAADPTFVNRDSRTGVADPTDPAFRSEQMEQTSPGRARIIAIANQKGGVGKTTTAVNLAAAIARAGRRVILIDVDPQANATSGLGLRATSGSSTYDLLIGGIDFGSAVRPTGIENLELVPASPGLAAAEVELVDTVNRESVLRRAMEGAIRSHEYVLIDCPPSLGLLTINALVAADSVLIPLQCEYFALEGVTRLLDTLSRIQQGLNPRLEIEGVLLTMYDGRLNLSAQVAEEARRHFGGRVYETMIPRNVRLGEAPSFGKPIVEYDPACIGAISYLHLAKEILEHVR